MVVDVGVQTVIECGMALLSAGLIGYAAGITRGRRHGSDQYHRGVQHGMEAIIEASKLHREGKLRPGTTDVGRRLDG